jgi:predicted Zn-dependent protease
MFHPFDRRLAEQEAQPTAYSQGNGNSKIGLGVFDERISVSQDCMDPDLGFPPFSDAGEVYHPVNWVENGVLKQLPHNQEYAIQKLSQPNGRPSSVAFRMSGGTATVEEMIVTTKRGLLVTRFSEVRVIDRPSLLSTGYTRDGLWLIEHGKISKAVYNFKFTESPMFMLNNIEQIGVPQRVFRPHAPAVVPPLKVRDFSFTSLSDAV